MVTFTLPRQLRPLAWQHQRLVYDLLLKLAWQTLSDFGLNDPRLQGKIGAHAVLHTHSRRLDFHPHVHFIIPAGALDTKHRLWRRKNGAYCSIKATWPRCSVPSGFRRSRMRD